MKEWSADFGECSPSPQNSTCHGLESNFIIDINQLISTERSLLLGSPDPQTSLDIQQGAGAEPLLGMLASVARVLASVAQGLASVA